MGDPLRVNKAARKERLQSLGWWKWFVLRRTALTGAGTPDADKQASEEVERHIEGGLSAEDVPYAEECGEAVHVPDGRVFFPKVDVRECRDPVAIIWYLYENIDNLEATESTAPSRGAWYQLQAIRGSVDLRSEFYRNTWPKVIPPKSKVDGGGEKVHERDTSIVKVADVYRTLREAANSKGPGGEPAVEGGGSEEGGGVEELSAGVDEGE